MSEAGFEVVEHTADWALRVRGANLSQLFAQAAVGLCSLLVEESETIPGDETRILDIEAYDAESLLVEWLNELAFLAEMEMLVFPGIHIQEISSTQLSAEVSGGRVSRLNGHIKAVTFHNLEILEREGGLEVTIVFDV